MDENIKDEIIENTESQVEPQSPTDEDISIFRGKIIKFLALSIVYVFIIGITFFAPVLMSKPAIYLYPETTSKIEVKLDKSIKYQTVIPKYHKGWVVEAEPNGTIRDLQPKYTDCKKLPYKQFGFEYSKNACEINKYPYIYWDGYQMKKPLPKKDEGFIVKNEDIVSFLTSKADEMGFIEAEKKEFVRYWTKRMQEKKWKYYRVYFLQNEEVDNYMPIYVTPQPDSSNRVQIIIKKGKKNNKITEQKLIPFNRNGFTLVEWGGTIK